MTARPQRVARALTNALNPFFIFTALYALVALVDAGVSRGLPFLAVELLAAAAVAVGGLLDLRSRRTPHTGPVLAGCLRGAPGDPLLFRRPARPLPVDPLYGAREHGGRPDHDPV